AAAMAQRAPAARVELYERDAAAFSRPQGYAIGLRNEAGMGVLTELGLRERVLARDVVKVDRFVICDQAGQELLALGSSRDDRYATYRVQRAHLRRELLAAIGGAAGHSGPRSPRVRP